jgi:hypothetical protein
LPQAEQAFKASEIGYLTGKVDFLNLLESERMVLMVKIGYFKAISNLSKSLARLERIVGKDVLSKPDEESVRIEGLFSPEFPGNNDANKKVNGINIKNKIKQGGNENE